MAGNENIMKILAEMQAQMKATANEMQVHMKASEDKRKEEREEDKKELKELRSGIVDEMKQIVKPWEERTSKIEDEVKKLTAEVFELKEMKGKELLEKEEEKKMQREEEKEAKKLNDKEVKELRETVEKLQQRPEKTYANIVASGIESGKRVGASDDNLEKERKLFRAAKCVIGLKPIEKRHVEERMKALEEAGKCENKSEDEKMELAKWEAAKEFLKMEMKMSEDNIEKMFPTKVFTTTKSDWNTLYVNFATERDVQFVMSFTQYMRKGVFGDERPEVVKYIPKEMFNRFKAVTRIGNKARIESDKTINFRVSLGEEDFVLQYKQKGTKFWEKSVVLPSDLPGFEHQIPRGDKSPGEAPGRKPVNEENEKKRGRPSSSSSGITPPSKKTSEDNVENLELAGSKNTQ